MKSLAILTISTFLILPTLSAADGDQEAAMAKKIDCLILKTLSVEFAQGASKYPSKEEVLVAPSDYTRSNDLRAARYRNEVRHDAAEKLLETEECNEFFEPLLERIDSQVEADR